MNVNDLFIQNKLVILFFAAKCSAPCVAFTPILEKFYKQVNKKDILERKLSEMSTTMTPENIELYLN